MGLSSDSNLDNNFKNIFSNDANKRFSSSRQYELIYNNISEETIFNHFSNWLEKDEFEIFSYLDNDSSFKVSLNLSKPMKLRIYHKLLLINETFPYSIRNFPNKVKKILVLNNLNLSSQENHKDYDNDVVEEDQIYENAKLQSYSFNGRDSKISMKNSIFIDHEIEEQIKTPNSKKRFYWLYRKCYSLAGSYYSDKNKFYPYDLLKSKIKRDLHHLCFNLHDFNGGNFAIIYLRSLKS